MRIGAGVERRSVLALMWKALWRAGYQVGRDCDASSDASPAAYWIVDRAKAVVAPIGRYFYRAREHQWEHFSNTQNH